MERIDDSSSHRYKLINERYLGEQSLLYG